MRAPTHRDCTAFRMADLRAGARWVERGGPGPGPGAADDDSVIYVWHDDLSVVAGPLVPGGRVLLDAAAAARDSGWQRYCRQTLQLMTPAPQTDGGTAQ
jgi:hypothetical protein